MPSVDHSTSSGGGITLSTLLREMQSWGEVDIGRYRHICGFTVDAGTNQRIPINVIGAVSDILIAARFHPTAAKNNVNKDIGFAMEPIAIGMITDFVHPNVGRVENHVYMLRLSVVTSHSPNRVGIRRLLPSLKVYYPPFVPIASSAMLPNFFPTSGRFSFGGTFTSSLRVPVYPLAGTKKLCILIYLASERCSLTTVCLASKTLRSFVYLILGEDIYILSLCCTEYLVRDKVYVIANALVPEHFQPGTLKTSDIASISSSPPLPVSATPSRTSALSLAATVIELPQMREKHDLQDRIELLGSIRPNAVRSVLV
ncbi:hypothetical protein ARMGADRAFT_1091089 [Armillaria gallica]|uniref:Uncharacterized protein n=1 Tax=Armillaria gallica TaxID=47427 RepID=A0A2H3CR33_ARMGA|nr:hypothetical protein ARMGADRAFT_1091089 [Armillaria gallica]